MANLMDNSQFMSVPQNDMNLESFIQQAKQNPQWLEQQVKQMNPAAYQQALQIRNSANPQAVIMQMAKARGINPNIMRMLGLM